MTFKESLPQGSVLSHLLFAIYIDDLVELEDNDIVRAYADDLAIAHSECNKGMTITSLQPEVHKVVAWSADPQHIQVRDSLLLTGLEKLPGNPTSPLSVSECSAIPSQFSWLSSTTGSSSMSGCINLQSLEGMTWGGIHWTVVSSMSLLLLARIINRQDVVFHGCCRRSPLRFNCQCGQLLFRRHTEAESLSSIAGIGRSSNNKAI